MSEFESKFNVGEEVTFKTSIVIGDKQVFDVDMMLSIVDLMHIPAKRGKWCTWYEICVGEDIVNKLKSANLDITIGSVDELSNYMSTTFGIALTQYSLSNNCILVTERHLISNPLKKILTSINNELGL